MKEADEEFGNISYSSSCANLSCLSDYCDGSGKECHLKNRCLYHLKYGDVASSHGNLVVETAESDGPVDCLLYLT